MSLLYVKSVCMYVNKSIPNPEAANLATERDMQAY